MTAIAVTLPLALAAWSGWQLWRIDASSATSDEDTRQALNAYNALLLAGIDEESALRGYLLTGSSEFLEAFASGRTRAEDALRRLAQLESRAPDRPAVAGPLRERFDAVETVLENALAEGPSVRRDSELFATSRARLDALRSTLVEARTRELRNQEARRERNQDAYQRHLLFLLAATALSMLAFGGAILRVRLARRERARAEGRREEAFAALERSVRQKEETLASLTALYSSAPLGLLFVDRERHCRQANEPILAAAGIEEEKVIDRPLGEAMPRLAEALDERLAAALAGRTVAPTRLDGETFGRAGRRFLAGAYPVRVGGEVIGAGVVLVEVTEQVRLAAALARFDRKLSSIVESISEASITADEARRVTYLNAEAERIAARPRAELLGRPLVDVWPALRSAEIEAALGRAEAGQSAAPLEVSDREGRWFDVRLHPADEGIALYGREITETHRRRLDQAFLAEATRQLHSSLDLGTTIEAAAHLAAPVVSDWCGVWIAEDPNETPRLMALAGPSPEDEQVARAADGLELRLDEAPASVRVGQSLLAEHLDASLIGRLFPAEGDRAAVERFGARSLVAVPLWARGRRLGSVAMAQSTSGRVFTERDLGVIEEFGRRVAVAVDNARLYREAHEAIRLRDEFLAVAAHELRTPLTAARLHSDSLLRMLQKGEGDPARMLRKVEQGRRQFLRLTELIDDLLDISRISAGRLTLVPEPADLAVIARDVVDRFQLIQDEARLLLSVDAPAPVRGVWDPVRIEQVLTNLVSNALKYGARQPVVVHVRNHDGEAQLEVEDHGIGIRAEDQERLFHRFERGVSYREYSGFGLGLWIVSEIVEAMGGRIHVESEPGLGARFIVDVPRETHAAQVGEAHLLH